MRIEDLLIAVNKSADEKVKCNVTVKDQTRSAFRGFFCKMDDHEELSSKKMVRFVPDRHIEMFERTNSKGWTRILNLNNLYFIKF